ncbi:hypothetical protein ACULNC_13635 [Shigella flexneri]
MRALISGTLMKGITPQQIFPVSSMWGYLANRPRYELANNGKLPAPEQQRWVEDLAMPRSAGAGVRRSGGPLNIFVMLPISCGKIRCSPSQALLHAAYANASLYALRSAAHKLLNYAQQGRGKS